MNVYRGLAFDINFNSDSWAWEAVGLPFKFDITAESDDQAIIEVRSAINAFLSSN